MADVRPVEAAPPLPAVPRRRWMFAVPAAVLLLAAAVLVMLRAHRVAAPVRSTGSIQVTTSAGLDVAPNFSPDGLSLAYSSDRSGCFEIYVRSLPR